MSLHLLRPHRLFPRYRLRQSASHLKLVGLSAVLAVSLSACGNSGADYRPVVDLENPAIGPEQLARYDSDLAACQELARTYSYTNDHALTKAGAGAVIGTGLGALGGGLEGALAGAVIGTTVAAVDSGFDSWNKRESIVSKCLENRGHQIAG
ncbi:hypothetical protein [Pelagibius sp. Alg239-R121]|uniref:hypothetical protein n=1 Tax=Pelagibius sp. Alg239-R121 TaxID=2993448 RepID=UPI0024A74928|nr:hypothetical protein [Pelagibius sp. Alg239-R121]